MTEQIDMSRFIEARSDQLNSDDLLGSPRTVTITKVIGVEGDQPVAIHFEGDNGKPFKPCKTIRRVLVAIWGRYANDYVGRSMTLYRDDAVMFGGLQVGGIRISHMSHLDKETVVVVAKSKGKKAGMKILPLADQPKTDAKPDPAVKWSTGFIAKLPSLATVDAVDAFVIEKVGKLAELQTARPDLHGKVMAAVAARKAEIAPAASSFDDDDLTAAPAATPADPEFEKALADIAAAPDIAAVTALDQKTDAHRPFLTDAQCDRLNEALATRRAELRVKAEA